MHDTYQKLNVSDNLLTQEHEKGFRLNILVSKHNISFGVKLQRYQKTSFSPAAASRRDVASAFFFASCDLHSHTLLLLLREHKLAEGAIQRGERA